MSFMATTSSHSSASWQWQPRGERGGHRRTQRSKLPSLHLVVGVDDLNVGLGRLLSPKFTPVDSVPVFAHWSSLLARLATVEDPVATKLDEEGLKRQISPDQKHPSWSQEEAFGRSGAPSTNAEATDNSAPIFALSFAPQPQSANSVTHHFPATL